MGILGFNISHEGTLSYVEDGVHIFSLSEERILREKAFIGFPFSALRYVLEKGTLDPKQVDCVAVAVGKFPVGAAETFAFLLTEEKCYYDLQNEEKPKGFFNSDSSWKNITTEEECFLYVQKKIAEILVDCEINAPVRFFNHHLCHAASAYFSAGFEDRKVLAITMDGEGDSISASVNLCENGEIRTLSQTARKDSAGNIYAAVTKFCGYKIARHEGKITGLAAYGNPEKAYNFFSKHINVRDGKLCIDGLKELNLGQRVVYRILGLFGISIPRAHDELVSRCGNIPKEDLAAGVQLLLEERITEIVSYWIEKTGVRSVVVAGGLFANIKFNQKISELDCIDKLFIYPDMGDGGLAYGAAMLARESNDRYDPEALKLSHVYLGPQFTDEEVIAYLEKHPNVIARRSQNIAKASAELIADNRIVGWFQGRMEYGPRALGNRSILASAVDANINKLLNERLNRTEFMPFAPSCLFEETDQVFDIPKESLKRAAEFMTISFRVRKEWLDRIPAIVHVDNTARPHIVRKQANPLFYDVLHEFKELTGLPLIVNTSFNSHEEPIICHPDDAINALERGVVDCLAIGNLIIEKVN